MKNELEIFDYLHDTGVTSLEFNFEKREISLVFTLWDDLEQQEVPLQLNMLGVSKFQSEYPENLDFQVVGCHSAQVQQTGAHEYEATFLLDFLKNAVSWKVVIGFHGMEVIGGLTQAALIEKYGQV